MKAESNPDDPLSPDNFVIPSKSDLSSYFYYYGLHYLKDNGLLGYIASDSWLNKGYGRKLQEIILIQKLLVSLVVQEKLH
mgnify:CR=1 FL=1